MQQSHQTCSNETDEEADSSLEQSSINIHFHLIKNVLLVAPTFKKVVKVRGVMDSTIVPLGTVLTPFKVSDISNLCKETTSSTSKINCFETKLHQ